MATSYPNNVKTHLSHILLIFGYMFVSMSCFWSTISKIYNISKNSNIQFCQKAIFCGSRVLARSRCELLGTPRPIGHFRILGRCVFTTQHLIRLNIFQKQLNVHGTYITDMLLINLLWQTQLFCITRISCNVVIIWRNLTWYDVNTVPNKKPPFNIYFHEYIVFL